jgi:hypothetical protein
MTYDPKEDEKYHTKKLPPEWYSRLEDFFTFHWRLMGVILLLVFFFAFPFFVDEPLDYLPAYEDSSR